MEGSGAAIAACVRSLNYGICDFRWPEEETKLDDGGNGDADRFAHYVSRDRIAESKMTGRPVVALCGKVWVPKRDPTHYPVCPDCKRIYDEMMNSSF